MKIIFPPHTLRTKTFGPITAFSYKRVISRRVTWWTGLALFRHLTFWHRHFIPVDVLACVLIGPLDVPTHKQTDKGIFWHRGRFGMGTQDITAMEHFVTRIFDTRRFSTGAYFGDSQLTSVPII